MQNLRPIAAHHSEAETQEACRIARRHNGDCSAIDELFRPQLYGMILIQPKAKIGSKTEDCIRRIQKPFPGLQFRVGDVIAQSDKVVTRLRVRLQEKEFL